MVFALDNEILGNHATFLCMKQDGSGNRLDNAGYQIVANNYYYCYMSCCCFLNKPDEADKLFDHFAPYRLQNVLDGIYATVAIYVRFKWSSSVADEHRVWASAYLLKKFKDDGVKDSLTMPINMLLQSLNDPALVDTTVPDRANELYLIYRDIDFFRLGNKDNLFITEKAESDMFAQVMRCMTYHTNIPGLLESMQYLGHSVVDRIIGMNDPDLLNKIIFMCEQYKKGSGKRVKEPYFWQNMAKFYMKAGNTDAANKAIEKAKKDKY